jgi:predicted DNA-binding transcriptional regulator AlpA
LNVAKNELVLAGNFGSFAAKMRALFNYISGIAMQNSSIKGSTRVAPADSFLHPDALIRIHHILGDPTRNVPPLLACGRTQFYAWINEGKFPRPRKLGHASYWRAGDVLDALVKLGRDSVIGRAR